MKKVHCTITVWASEIQKPIFGEGWIIIIIIIIIFFTQGFPLRAISQPLMS